MFYTPDAVVGPLGFALFVLAAVPYYAFVLADAQCLAAAANAAAAAAVLCVVSRWH